MTQPSPQGDLRGLGRAGDGMAILNLVLQGHVAGLSHDHFLQAFTPILSPSMELNLKFSPKSRRMKKQNKNPSCQGCLAK